MCFRDTDGSTPPLTPSYDGVWPKIFIPRLHDTTGCQTGLYNRFDNRLYTRYSRLSNHLSNGFDNRLYRVNGALSCNGDIVAHQ